MPIPTDEERIGTLVADRYRIESIIGRGGMGVVFEATHTWTGRHVALKVMKPDYASDATGVRRFLQEARTAAKIEHPHVVDVLDMGADEGGDVFLVLELLEGEPLARLLDREKRLTAQTSLTLLLPIVRALRVAHGLGILHRDIKPDNVFVSRDGDGARVPKLLDFGMAKIQESTWGNTTATGTLLGTPFYMSPEQAEGAPDVGPAADVWSMGAVLYRCLTGRPPFVGRNPTAILLAITRGELTPVQELAPDVPDAVADVVHRTLVPDREQRIADMGALRTALVRAARESGITLSPAVTGEAEAELDSAGEIASGAEAMAPRRDERASRMRKFAGVVAVAAAGIALAAVAFGLRDGTSRVPSGSVGPTAAQADAPPDAPAPSASFVEPPTSEPQVAQLPSAERRALHVTTEPAGALVAVDGERACVTPCEVSRAPDEATALEIELRGYQTRRLTVEPGRTDVDVRLRPRHGSATGRGSGSTMRAGMGGPQLPPGLF